MKIELADIDAIIEKNKLPEVSNPVYINADKTPTDDGIFSYTIYGRPGSKRRKLQFAYIDLGKHFMHPLAYKEFSRICSQASAILTGTKRFTVSARGELIEDEKGGTGIEWLYTNWDKLKFDDRNNRSRSNRIELLKIYKRNQIFCTKWITIPAFYYDINFTKELSRISIDEIGDMYVGLISKCQSLRGEGGFFTTYALEAKIQEQLVAIMDYFIGKIAKKNGLIHSTMLGKNIDYTTRAVISAEHMGDADHYDEVPVLFEEVGVPLHQMAALALPFVSYEFKALLRGLNEDAFLVEESHGKFTQVNFESMSTDFAETFVANFARTREFRVEPFFVKKSDGKPLDFTSYHAFESLGTLKREMNNTDILYYLTKLAIQGKHIIVTRYPIEDYSNISCHRPVILTTEAVTTVGDDRFYPDFSVTPVKWNETVQLHPAVLKAMGADFDGDTVTLKMVYTTEANRELEDYIYSPKNITDLTGDVSRKFGAEPIQALYTLTY